MARCRILQPHPSSGLPSWVMYDIVVVVVLPTGSGVSEEEELPNNPSFVFLQLYHSAALSLPPAPGHTPLLLSADEVRGHR